MQLARTLHPVRAGRSWLARRRFAHPVTLAAGVTLLVFAAACRDLPTGPGPSQIAYNGLSRFSNVPGPEFGSDNSPLGGSWNGEIDPAWGGTTVGWIGAFKYPTIITFDVAGIVTQGAGALPAPNPPGTWGPLGDAFHSGSIAYYVGEVGASVYWPTHETGNVIVMPANSNLGAARAQITGAQPQGDASHCGWGRTPEWWCYTYTGSASLTFTTPQAGMGLSRNGPANLTSGTSVTFTITPLPATLYGLATPVSGVQWTWIPDYYQPGDDLTPCETTLGNTCTRKIPGPGVMVASAYINGVHQLLSLRAMNPPGAIAACADVTGYSTQHPEIANAAADSAFKWLWDQSNVRDNSTQQSFRVLRAGWMLRNGTTYSFQPFAAVPTICSIDVAHEVKPDSAVALVHTHPWQLGERMAGCGPLKKRDGTNLLDQNGDPQYAVYRGVSSEDDVDVASQSWSNVTTYVLDAAGISKVKYDGTATRFPGTSLQRCGY